MLNPIRYFFIGRRDAQIAQKVSSRQRLSFDEIRALIEKSKREQVSLAPTISNDLTIMFYELGYRTA